MKKSLPMQRWVTLFLVMIAITLGISPLAHAGAGAGLSTDITGADRIVPTYYANSPAGTWTDWQGISHNSGTPLRKFVDPLPGLCGGAGTPIPSIATSKCIPVANPQPSPIAGENADYYEIGIVEYSEPMHSDLPKATMLRGYVQLNDPANPVKDLAGNVVLATAVANARYLGPIIVAKRNTPVRIKYTNLLPTGHFDPNNPGAGRGGDLFLPVDKTLMGAGTGPNGGTETYTENRAGIHLHGGDNPWISDGTPHQWITPAGEATSYLSGASFQNVPDMPIPSQGSGTLYYPNGDGGRLMFYHDHAAGITRLNVYAGEAAGYRLDEPLVEGPGTPLGTALPAVQLPLVIQERTFVPNDIAVQDAKWNTAAWGAYGDLWYPHVYETNQDPNSFDGTNPVGRWDYGPWFWPIFPVPDFLPTGDYSGCTLFNGVNICGSQVSTTPEAFGDTPIVNGTAYPTTTVDPTAYRFRILNASNDRTLNLGLYTADPSVITSDSRTDTEVRMIPFSGPNTPTSAYICPPSGMTPVSAAYPVSFPCKGGLQGTGWGAQDNRPGGIPDPGTAGPNIWQIGSEGGFLPNVADIPSTPVNYEYNKRSVTVLNVLERGLYMMPAERADVVVDFSQFAGQTLIMYNDAPAPLPAGDPRIDYYTGNPDQTAVGGAPSTLPGFGPNTRTVMQIKVGVGTHAGAGTISTIKILNGGIGYSSAPTITITDGVTSDTGTATFAPGGVITSITPANPTRVYSAAPKVTITDVTGTGAVTLAYLTPAPAYNLAALKTALSQAYAVSQPRPIVAEAAYNTAFGATFTNQYARIFTGASLQPQVTWIDGNGAAKCYSVSGMCGTAPADGLILNKAIQELFDSHGRMNATLGVELPFTSALNQTTIPLGYIDPVTETIADGETQIWKITHNGVDSHPVHFHLVNVQVINRVGWDGTVKPPNANEVGWKETVKMNPLEDIVVAVKAKSPKLPGFGLPTSWRALDPTQPLGVATGLTQIDPATGNPITVLNKLADFGWEYVWHCHILGHEENDFMRPFVLQVTNTLPIAPTLVSGTVISSPLQVSLTWVDNSSNELYFRIERATGAGPFVVIGTALANATTFADMTVIAGNTYTYRVFAGGAAGDSLPSNTITVSVLPLSITTTTLASGTAGIPYGPQTLTATGGTPPYTWTATGLPAGLTLNGATGVINGTPTVTGIFTISPQVKDSNNITATTSLSLTINSPVTISTSILPDGAVGVSYVQILTATGGNAPYTWALTAGTLPGGLKLSTSTGTILGTPTTAGAFSFTIKATDVSGNSASKPLSINISQVAITTTNLAAATVGSSYYFGLKAVGGVTPYTWSATGLPAGLTMGSTGIITGTPTAAGTFTVSVQVKDTVGTIATKNFALTVGVAPLAVTTASLPSGIVGTTYYTGLTASGGVKPYTWSATGLPAGLAMGTSGIISGTPTTPGTFTVSVQVKDTLGTISSKNLSLTIGVAPLIITTASLPAGTVGTPYWLGLTATGGVKPYTWSATGLPAGLAMGTSGIITGTPTFPTTVTVSVQVTDVQGTITSKNFSMTIGVAPLTISTASLPAGTVGITYSAGLAATGGVKPYTWSLSIGSLPPGLTLNSAGSISGRPTTAGSFTFTLQVADFFGTTPATKPFTIVIN